MGNGSQDGTVGSFRHLEAPGERLHNLHGSVAQQNDGSSLYNVGPAPGAHGLEGKGQGGNLVFRQFDDEEGFPVLVPGDLVHQQGSQENQHDAGNVHDKADPAGIVKERAGKQGDDGDLGAAGHERG